eukprot:8457020-Pyramimonas_sp.AAC.1
MSKSSADALDNLNESEQRQPKWVSNPEACRRAALAGQTLPNSQPGAAPPWRPDSSVAHAPRAMGHTFSIWNPSSSDSLNG